MRLKIALTKTGLLATWQRRIDHLLVGFEIPEASLTRQMRMCLEKSKRVKTIRADDVLKSACIFGGTAWLLFAFIALATFNGIFILIGTILFLIAAGAVYAMSPIYCPDCKCEMMKQSDDIACIVWYTCSSCGCYSNLHHLEDLG
jgi:hypothetical protein